MCHSNGGGGKATTPSEEPDDKQSEAGGARQRANSTANEDLSILKAVWSCSHPHVRHFAAKWGRGHGGYNAPSTPRAAMNNAHASPGFVFFGMF
jgi:hypothetical protein